ncbi:intradiol ring-cleavage dioxygenase [Chryseolinea soli]|uniref:Intradiol ring-cleavage dioxygenase n=1 Tax=Chryseolinea soli TaxID=2321403 RepID=A0A385SUR9_9BACT|nr:intradiol ring-cleavage dioxygenase [Chryseolinea soli]AYB33450.1 intradiol ring-cleavage dioxygenase [Chryseolinea soli]
MQRKEFIKRLGFGSLMVPLVVACGKDDDPTPATDTTTTSGTCTVSPSETAGPFPTKTPADLVMVDIRSDRTGIEMTVTITIQNSNNSCAALADAIVDIWHCDKDGYYSEYGGSGMQSVDYQSVHFLRGRQSTNSDGVVAFKTIFPGWYSGRAPHIHAHIYDSTGKSLLVTQIAFPTDVCNTVYTTATNFYTKGTQDTSNASDNVFSDSIANEMSTVTGSVADGFALTHTIVVSA